MRITIYTVVRFLALTLVVQICLIMMVFLSAYQSRHVLVEAGRSGCERLKQDRRLNAQGWREAEIARLTAHDYDVASEYARIAGILERRAYLNCERAYPEPPFFAFGFH